MTVSETALADRNTIDALWTRIKDADSALDTRIGILEGFEAPELTWAEVSSLVQKKVARHYFKPGYQFMLNYAGTEYPVDVCHHLDGSDDDHPLATFEDGTTGPAMILQFHRTVPFAVPFDSKEAFYYVSDALSAGTTYTFNTVVSIAWGSGTWATVGTRSWQFTPSSDIPVGSQLVFSGSPYDALLSTMSVQVFTDFASSSAAQTCAISEGSTGTSLGDLTETAHDNFNTFPRSCFGSNNWPTSGAREWLNSYAAAGSWDTRSTLWDRPHALATSTAGFLSGLDEDVVAVLRSIQVQTESHPKDLASGAIETTYDKVFLPSARQHYFTNYLSESTDGYAKSGVPWDYWKELAAANGRTSPWPGWSAFSELITYDGKTTATPRNVWLRSAYRYPVSSNRVGIVTTSGYIDYGNASSSYYVAPAIAIG